MTLVNVTIPVFNEETRLAASIPRLRRFLTECCRFQFEIVIADNASTDGTREIARCLSRAHEGVRVVHLDEKGRGRAVKKVWNESAGDILSYMDVDLSTDLNAFPPLIESLISGGFDMATGSRLLKPSLTTRGFKREMISRCYNILVKALFHTQFSDAQCGFKAVTRKAAEELLPLVEDTGWFMDTELLVLAEKLGWRIFDLPVRWTDDSDSRVKIWSTAIADIEGLIRLRRNFAAGKYSNYGQGKERRVGSAPGTSRGRTELKVGSRV
jgi:glycosyltransferase involved in cell wall biosynthesis